jgi:hypothetical protein
MAATSQSWNDCGRDLLLPLTAQAASSLYEVHHLVVDPGRWRVTIKLGSQLCADSLYIGVLRGTVGAFDAVPKIDDRYASSVGVLGGNVQQLAVLGSFGSDDWIHHSVLELEELVWVAGNGEDRQTLWHMSSLGGLTSDHTAALREVRIAMVATFIVAFRRPPERRGSYSRTQQ